MLVDASIVAKLTPIHVGGYIHIGATKSQIPSQYPSIPLHTHQLQALLISRKSKLLDLLITKPLLDITHSVPVAFRLRNALHRIMPSRRPRHALRRLAPFEHAIEVDNHGAAIPFDHQIIYLQIIMHIAQRMEMFHARFQRREEVRAALGERGVTVCAVPEVFFPAAGQGVHEVCQRRLVPREADAAVVAVDDDAALILRDAGVRGRAEQLAEANFAEGALLQVVEVARVVVDF